MVAAVHIATTLLAVSRYNYRIKCVSVCSSSMCLPANVYITSSVILKQVCSACFLGGGGEATDHGRCITKHKLSHVHRFGVETNKTRGGTPMEQPMEQPTCPCQWNQEPFMLKKVWVSIEAINLQSTGIDYHPWRLCKSTFGMYVVGIHIAAGSQSHSLF